MFTVIQTLCCKCSWVCCTL